jgi:mono/diheme cytochrome c family protein
MRDKFVVAATLWAIVTGAGCKLDARIDATLALTGDPVNGASVYSNICEECHAADFNGTLKGPSLRILVPLNDDDEIVEQVIVGEGDMPAFGDDLVDQEIADVLVFLRQEIP